MDYKEMLKKHDESSYLISMVSLDEITRLGHSLKLNEETTVLDLCCGYGQVLKIWSEAFGISGVGVDLCSEYIEVGQKRLEESKCRNVRLIESDVLAYADTAKYDVVICSETFDDIDTTLRIGERYLKQNGVLIYHKVFAKKPNPPQELIDFEGQLLTLQELNETFMRQGYYMTHMASDSTSDWERYIMWSARRDLKKLRRDLENTQMKEWLHKWYRMYFDFRREYQGQGMFALEKL